VLSQAKEDKKGKKKKGTKVTNDLVGNESAAAKQLKQSLSKEPRYC
jgi:hypothetical protein